ncbi:MAG: hypothetical protein LBF22_06465 [Deltaproteobacteria bacterium]|jgi:hypothetical protein|nr:hypothetical protein [Deltaproteobacteria bacterium]
MKTFSELWQRLAGLTTHLDGELWDNILKELNPPNEFPRDSLIQDLCFRDSKALAGYVPDLRHVMQKNSPKTLPKEEFRAFEHIHGLYNLTARLPVLLLSIQDYKTTEPLIDVYNGYRQILLELNEYLALAREGRS